jgi:hypothetical protein
MVRREGRARLAWLLLLHGAPAQGVQSTVSPCVDEDSHCKQWSQMGECENNPKLTRTPRGSCGARTSLPRWVRTGGAGRPVPRPPRTVRTGNAYQPPYVQRFLWHPRNNPGFMHLACALTCGTCAKQRARGRRHECDDIGA